MQVHNSRRKDNAEGDDEGNLLDLGVGVWRGPGESDEDEQGDDVDEEPDRLEEADVGDLVVRHVLHWTEKDEKVRPGGEESTDNSCVSHFFGFSLFVQLRELVRQLKLFFHCRNCGVRVEVADGHIEEENENNVDCRKPFRHNDGEDEGARVEDETGEKERQGDEELLQGVHQLNNQLSDLILHGLVLLGWFWLGVFPLKNHNFQGNLCDDEGT